MTTLIIETSSERGVIAIAEGRKVLETVELPIGLRHSNHLMEHISALVDPKALSAVAVGVGPGSYTGIRVGAAAGQAIAMALKLPLIALPTLHGFVPIVTGRYAAIIDARISGCYLHIGEIEDERHHIHREAFICSRDDIHDHLEGVNILVTPNRERLDKWLQWEGEWHVGPPSAEKYAAMAALKLAESPDEPFEMLYLRKTQAELELAGRN